MSCSWNGKVFVHRILRNLIHNVNVPLYETIYFKRLINLINLKLSCSNDIILNYLYKFRTKYDVLKGWFNSNCLNKSTIELFIIFEQVNKNKLFSIREMVNEISGEGSRDYQHVHKKHKIPRRSNRCACFKNKVLCNSRYHKEVTWKRLY